jgi:hypothetical protein
MFGVTRRRSGVVDSFPLPFSLRIPVGAALVVLLLVSLLVVVLGLCGLVDLSRAVYISCLSLCSAGGILLTVFFPKVENGSLLCTAEVAVDAETQLTIRSWWAADLGLAEVRANGARVAMENAERWTRENRNFINEIYFDEEKLIKVIPTHLSGNSPLLSVELRCLQCAVCFEDCEEHSRLRLCGHPVHPECAAAWFRSSKRATCPMCRCDHTSLVPEEVKVEKQPHTLRIINIRVQSAPLPDA